jgi:hypothetical protein
MKEFMLLFRFPNVDDNTMSNEDFQAIAKKWKNWSGGIVGQGRLVSHGPRLDVAGKVLKAGGIITDGPFVEIREYLGSFVIVKAESLDEATTLAHGCPVLEQGGSVEIRPVFG